MCLSLFSFWKRSQMQSAVICGSSLQQLPACITKCSGRTMAQLTFHEWTWPTPSVWSGKYVLPSRQRSSTGVALVLSGSKTAPIIAVAGTVWYANNHAVLNTQSQLRPWLWGVETVPNLQKRTHQLRQAWCVVPGYTHPAKGRLLNPTLLDLDPVPLLLFHNSSMWWQCW